MYIPKRYELAAQEAALSICTENPFASFITVKDGKSHLTQLPLLRVKDSGERLTFFGHIARNNPQAEHIQTGAEAHCLFAGAHHYISPAWYVKKDVPTWNYTSAQVWGTLRVVEDASELAAGLEETTAYFENLYQTGFSLSELDESYVQGSARGIIGFYLNVTVIRGKEKLSQNKPAETRQRIRAGLEAFSSDSAKEMAKRITV